jgi:senataxin
MSTPANVLSALATCRSEPESPEHLKKATEIALGWLLSLPCSAEPVPHWFCRKALARHTLSSNQELDALEEATTILVRLSAFKPVGPIGQWNQGRDACLRNCCDCVQGWESKKTGLRERYSSHTFILNARPSLILSPRYFAPRASDRTVDQFFSTLNEKEAERIMDVISASPSSSSTLGTPPAAVLHHILISPHLFQRSDILALLSSHLPSSAIRELPSAPSPGLVLLAVHRDGWLRAFARAQLSICDAVRIHQWTGNLKSAVESIVTVLNVRDLPPGANSEPMQLLKMDYADDREAFWSGFAAVLDVLDPQVIGGTGAKVKDHSVDVARLVSRHLGDRGSHFIHVLQAWRALLRKLKEALWVDVEDEDFAQVALDSVLDNPSFEEEVQSLEPVAQTPPVFAWILPFLHSVAKSETYFVPTLGSIAQVLLNRLQQPRFEEHHRALAVHAALDAFIAVFTYSSSSSSSYWPFSRAAAKSVLDVHADLLVRLAFGKPPQTFDKSPSETFWQSTSSYAFDFVEKVATRDSTRLCNTVYALSSLLEEDKSKSVSPPIVYVSQGLWTKAYAEIGSGSLRDTDFRAQAGFLRALASSAHLEALSPRVWAPQSVETSKAIRPATKAINEAFKTVRGPLASILMMLADADSSTIRYAFLRKPRIPESLVPFILSPVEELHNAALSIVRNAYDVESRSDCFAAILRDFPTQTIRGLIFAITTFETSANILPDSCGAAKRLVRCLTDVNNVLCDPTSGLFRRPDWLAQATSHVPKLWNYMCKAIGLIFVTTPKWAAYFENEEMTDWMRDAITFADGLLEHMRTFESAALGNVNAFPGASPKKTSNVGTAMIGALNDPLEKLLAWLRLNDLDLLQLTSVLVTKLLDRLARSKLPVREKVVERLRKFADTEKRSNRILKDDQILALLLALSQHPDYANEFNNIKSFPKVASEKKKAEHKEWWGKVKESTTKAKKSEASSKDELIILDGDELQQKATTSPSKTARDFLSKTATTTPTTGTSVKELRKGFQQAPLNFGRQPMHNGTLGKRLTYSHSALRAAQDRLSTDEESSEEEVEAAKGAGLKSLAKQQKSPKARKTVQILQSGSRRTKLLEGPADRSVQAMRRRRNENAAQLIAPADYSRLHRMILQWDYKHTGTSPPDAPDRPRRLPLRFGSTLDYIHYFEPLLILETWQSLLQAKEAEEANQVEPVPCEVAGCQSVDDFTDVFAFVQAGKMPAKTTFTDSDVVLLRSGQRSILAKVQGVVSKHQQFDITFRCHFGKDKYGASATLVPRSSLEIIKLFRYSLF